MTKQKGTEEKDWSFDNSYARLPEALFSRLYPTPVHSPELVILNHPLAEALGLDVQRLQSHDGVEVFAGNRIPKGASPIAQAYAGHQFGYFTRLGDGRALLLGEQITPGGDRFDIQLKGSGRTPYSRQGDGRAALGPMLREYIISEAMYGLGIPTTRSLAVVTTGEPIMRETEQPGAILTRVAASHIRVGTFQYISRWGTPEEIRLLADYTLQRHFPDADMDRSSCLVLLKEVIRRQALLIAKWQLAGFVHGVMNTDNMALSGETIDYGPCAFLDVYDKATVFSSIDIHGRYAYGNQPDIAEWNLARFAEALLPLLHANREKAVGLAQVALSAFAPMYRANWLTGMRSKLGIFNEEIEDIKLIENLLGMMEKYHADYTNTFRALTLDKPEDTTLSDTAEFGEWHRLWKERRKRQQQTEASSQQLMRDSNPAVIPRNHRVEEALEAAVKHGDYNVMKRLLEVVSVPFAYSAEQVEYSMPPAPTACRYRTFCGT